MTIPHLQQNWSNHYSFSCHVLDCQEGRASCIHQNRLVEAKASTPSSGLLCLRERWRDSWIKENVMSIYIYIFNTVTWADLLNSGAEIRFIWKFFGSSQIPLDLPSRIHVFCAGIFQDFWSLWCSCCGGLELPGRLLLNVWRALSLEVNFRYAACRFQPQGFLEVGGLKNLTLRC